MKAVFVEICFEGIVFVILKCNSIARFENEVYIIKMSITLKKLRTLSVINFRFLQFYRLKKVKPNFLKN